MSLNLFIIIDIITFLKVMMDEKKLSVKDLPADNRPRERLKEKGAENLTDYELLAIIMGKGSRKLSVIETAKQVLKEFSSLNAFGEVTLEQLQAIPGIGFAKACQILASIELGKRMSRKAVEKLNERNRRKTIRNYEDAINEMIKQMVSEKLNDFEREHFFVVCLDTKNRIIAIDPVSIGTLNASLVHPREVFLSAIKHHSSQIILVHNHPSGDPTPSEDDIKITRKLVEAGKLIEIQVIDHIIVTRNFEVYKSLREEGLMYGV